MKAQQLTNIGINLSGKTSGEIKTTCPKCSSERRNRHEKCLSVDIDRGLYNCHHCGWAGGVYEKPRKEYVKPTPRLEKVSEKMIQWFEGRGISNNTLLRFGITEAKEFMPQEGKEMNTICFNYYRGGELVNIKFRDAKKNFKLNKDSELIFYNLDNVGQHTVIVEGEIDALSVYECGFHNVISVPNGASKGVQRLEYLDNCWEQLQTVEAFVIMTDNDEPGMQLRDELVRRIGEEKCLRVEYPEGCKDANEILVKHGLVKLAEVISAARPFPIRGVVDLDDVRPEIIRLFEHGYPEAPGIMFGEFDDYLRFAPGQLTVVTGTPGSGKSEFVDLIAARTAAFHKWSWGVFAFEAPIHVHISRLMEKIAGRAFGFRREPDHRITKFQFDSALATVETFFHFVNIDEVDISIDGIIEKAEQLVKRKGIKAILIDPWNYVEQRKDRSQTETEYISEVLTKLKQFLKKYGVHCFLIAHPTKLKKENGKFEVPNLYSISGSAHFFNKTDNGFTVYRNDEDKTVDIHIQKVKNYWNGKLGMISFRYNTDTRQYELL